MKLRYSSFVVIITILVIMNGCAGLQRASNADLLICGVYEAPGSSKDQIFTASKKWVAENFNAYVIESENRKDGILFYKGEIRYPCSWLNCIHRLHWKVRFNMHVAVMDQKFTLTFYDIWMSQIDTYNSTTGWNPGFNEPVIWKRDIDEIKQKLLDIGDKLVTFIRNNSGLKN